MAKKKNPYKKPEVEPQDLPRRAKSAYRNSNMRASVTQLTSSQHGLSGHTSNYGSVSKFQTGFFSNQRVNRNGHRIVNSLKLNHHKMPSEMAVQPRVRNHTQFI
jgi:hypothetical protein